VDKRYQTNQTVTKNNGFAADFCGKSATIGVTANVSVARKDRGALTEIAQDGCKILG
jgi:hypothetical protein